MSGETSGKGGKTSPSLVSIKGLLSKVRSYLPNSVESIMATLEPLPEPTEITLSSPPETLSEAEAWAMLRSLLSEPSQFNWTRLLSLIDNFPTNHAEHASLYAKNHLSHWPDNIHRCWFERLESYHWKDFVLSQEEQKYASWSLCETLPVIIREYFPQDERLPLRIEKTQGISLCSSASGPSLASLLSMDELPENISTLILREHALTARDMETLRDVETPQLERLVIEDAWLASSLTWGRWLTSERFPALKSVILREGIYDFGEEMDGLETLFANSTAFSNLYSLRVENCYVSEEAARAFIHAEEGWQHLQTLEWISNAPPAFHVAYLFQHAERFPKLDSLSLEGNLLNLPLLRQLAESSLVPQLRRLNLNWNLLDEQNAMEAVCTGIEWKQLEELHLSTYSNSYLGPPDWYELATSNAFPSLKRLSLQGSDAVTKAFNRLLEAPWADQLEVLDLTQTGLTDKALSLLTIPGVLPSLRVLLLNNNELTDKGLKDFLESELAGRLNSLTLEYNNITKSTIQLLATTENLHGLQALSLAGVPLERDVCKTLFSAPALTNLTALRLDVLNEMIVQEFLESGLWGRLSSFQPAYPIRKALQQTNDELVSEPLQGYLRGWEMQERESHDYWWAWKKNGIAAPRWETWKPEAHDWVNWPGETKD